VQTNKTAAAARIVRSMMISGRIDIGILPPMPAKWNESAYLP
jgi:hypothetical protein